MALPKEPWVQVTKKERFLRIFPKVRRTKHWWIEKVEAERGHITVHLNEGARIHFLDRGGLHVVVEHPDLGTFGGPVRGHAWGVKSEDTRWRGALFRFLRGVPTEADLNVLEDFFARWGKVVEGRAKWGKEMGYLELYFGENGEHTLYMDMRFLASLFGYFHKWSPLRQKILPTAGPSSGRGGRRGLPDLRWRR